MIFGSHLPAYTSCLVAATGAEALVGADGVSIAEYQGKKIKSTHYIHSQWRVRGRGGGGGGGGDTGAPAPPPPPPFLDQTEAFPYLRVWMDQFLFAHFVSYKIVNLHLTFSIPRYKQGSYPFVNKKFKDFLRTHFLFFKDSIQCKKEP